MFFTFNKNANFLSSKPFYYAEADWLFKNLLHDFILTVEMLWKTAQRIAFT